MRLSPDEWIAAILGPDPPEDALDAARDPTERLLWHLAERLLSLGVDVILDFGFWTRAEREAFRDRATALGARTYIHVLDPPLERLLVRLAARNAALPAGCFRIDEHRLRHWHTLYERPEADELVFRDLKDPDPHALTLPI